MTNNIDIKLEKMRQSGERMKRRREAAVAEIEGTIAARIANAEHKEPVLIEEFLGRSEN